MRHVFTKAAAVAAVGVLAFTVAQPSQASTPSRGRSARPQRAPPTSR